MYRVFFTLVLLTAMLTGCTQASTPNPQIDMTGNISQVNPASGGRNLGVIRVEGQKIEGNAWDVAVVTITPQTRLWSKTSDGYRRAGWSDLAVGATITLKITGPVLESYPVQVTAEEVVILYLQPSQ